MKKAKIIAIANQKGGVGKTTLTIHLGAFLSRHEKRVILVDSDPQGNLTEWLLGQNPQVAGLSALLIGRLPPLKAVTYISGEWNLGLIPSYWETGNVLNYMAQPNMPFSTIRDRLAPMANVCDYVLIDTPPSWSIAYLQLLHAADLLIIPTQLERQSIEGVRLMAQACQHITETQGTGPRLLGIVPNLYRRHTNEHKHYLSMLIGQFKALIWPPISASIRVTEACSDGKSLFSYAPTEAVTSTMVKVCKRFLENTK